MNCSLNLVERRRRDPGWNAVPIDPGPAAESFAVSTTPTPEATLLGQEALLRREHAMRSLTPMERTAFLLRHMEEQPIQIIANALGISANATKQAIFRAVAKLRRELAPVSPHASATPLSPALAKESR
jgi:RNA polymerase sigma-70 factor (ECF subfamily)